MLNFKNNKKGSNLSIYDLDHFIWNRIRRTGPSYTVVGGETRASTRLLEDVASISSNLQVKIKSKFVC